jgi:1-acyl-sn-glycerol-3-phosphate acyltransferase
VARPKPGPAFTFIAVLMRPLLTTLCKRDWRGREHVPQDGGVIVVVNHYSFFDPLSVGHYLVAAGHRTPRFLAKSGVFKQPMLGKLFRAAGQIPVYRDSRDAALAFRDALTAVERGEVIIVYPEGTMTKDPDLWPMAGKTGAARIALRTGAPVLPIAQWGAQEVFASYSKKPQFFPRKTLKVTAGEPMDLRALVGPAATKDALERGTELIMDRLTEMLAEIRGEEPPAVRFQPDAQPEVQPGAKPDAQSDAKPTAEAAVEAAAGDPATEEAPSAALIGAESTLVDAAAAVDGGAAVESVAEISEAETADAAADAAADTDTDAHAADAAADEFAGTAAGSSTVPAPASAPVPTLAKSPAAAAAAPAAAFPATSPAASAAPAPATTTSPAASPASAPATATGTEAGRS